MQENALLLEKFTQLATILHNCRLASTVALIDCACGLGCISSHLVKTLLPTGHLRAGVADIRAKCVTLPRLWELG